MLRSLFYWTTLKNVSCYEQRRRLGRMMGLSYCRSLSSSSQSQQRESQQQRPDLSKVLIANRGEIACRIIRTCRKWNIPTVAVYSQIDKNALHVQMADEAYMIGSGHNTPSESYLRTNELLDIALSTNTQAIHPGYGFLSENAQFAHDVVSEGIRFVGPSSSAITKMGSKSESKSIMDDAGVTTTPGYYNDGNQSAEHLLQMAKEQVGFPLLIKAVSGGGGKGIRIVHNENEFIDKLSSCQRESMASFSDDRVLLEKYLINPRHVEVQIIADSYRNTVHLYERDCSLQRRHQKIIEEAPASDLSSLDIRQQQLGSMAVKAANAVGYVNAGTVEFLFESGNTTQPEFYFCEMNTRLQVEHPITECITGVDLVEWQLRVAAGETLPKTQYEIMCMGHAFEARLYAENPARDFLPATGHVYHHMPPTPGNTGLSKNGIRVDTGLQTGQDISVYYDPMISKLITYGKNRQMALDKLVMALKNYQIAGVPTNIDFLIKCANHPTFRKAGAVHTGFLDDHAEDVKVEEGHHTPPLAKAVGAFAVLLQMEHRIIIGDGDGSGSTKTKLDNKRTPWSTNWGSWRMSGERPHRTLSLPEEDDGVGSSTVVCTSNRDGSFDIQVVATADDNNDEEEEQHDESSSFHVSGSLTTEGTMEVVVNGTNRINLTTVLHEDNEGQLVKVRMWPQHYQGGEEYYWQVDVVNPMKARGGDAGIDGAAAATAGQVKAPMPGKISRINFDVGDTVKVGDVVVVMEAMKMEHSCPSPCSGIVTEIRCKPNDVVDDGALLFSVEEPTAEAA